MKNYIQVYKCRLCGELFNDGNVVCNGFTEELELRRSTPNLTGAHKCKFDIVAIGDFIGWKIEEIEQ